MTINDDDDDDDDSGGDGGDVGQRLWSHDRLALYKTNSIIHIKKNNQLFLHCWRFGLYHRAKRQQCKNNWLSWMNF